MSFTPCRIRQLALLLAVVLCAGLLAAVPVRAVASDGPAPVDGAVSTATGRTSALVHADPAAPLEEALTAARSVGIETGTVYDAIGVFVAYGTASEFGRLAERDAVQYVEANRRLRLSTDSSHEATRGQAVLNGATTMPDGTTIDGAGVGVAVVDTGVDGTHPDLAPRMGGNVKAVCAAPLVTFYVEGNTECRGVKTFVELDDTDHVSAGGHGTHVAGIVAGTGAASSGAFHGAAPGATLYGIGIGTFISAENSLDGLAWVLENHDQVSPPIKVVNNSWGSQYARYEQDSTYSATWKLQEELVDAGVTVVVAAGNASGTGATATTVAECVNPTPGIVCVANYDDQATGTRDGTIAPRSSRGSTTDVESWPDVSAPGTQIVSTCRVTLPLCDAMIPEPPDRYAFMSGTSMAAPHVAGIAAQLYQADPTLTPAEVENILEDTAYKFAFGSAYGLTVDPTNPDDTSSYEKGHGLVDALAAVATVLNGGVDPSPSPDPSAPPPSPTPEGTRYWFYSSTGNGEADLVSGGGRSFGTSPPAAPIYAEWRDLPGSNAAPREPFDPHWTGQIEEEIEMLTLDFWAKTPVEEGTGAVHYRPVVWVGDVPYVLPTLISPSPVASLGNVPERIVRTYTTMLDSAGNEVPLSIDPGDAPVTISIGGVDDIDAAGQWFNYGTDDYPSGFVVNGGL